MALDRNDVVKLMVDAYRGNVGTKFSKEEAVEGLRNALFEILGTDKVDYKVMRRKGAEVFELVEEALDQIIPETVEQQFDQFAEIKSYPFGDKPVFTVEDTALYDVAVIAEGNNNLRRQRIFPGRNLFTVETQWKGIKIYDEFIRFLAGRIDWPTMVRNVADSYNEHISADAYNVFVSAYPTIQAPYRESGDVTVESLTRLIEHVEAATGKSAVIVGTKSALSKIPVKYQTEQSGNTYNQLGYFGSFQGTPMRVLRQGYKKGTTEWAIDNNKLLVLPDGGVKPVKIVLEGDAIVKETADGLDTADMTMEYTFMKKYGVAVIQTTKYGLFDMG